MSKPDKTLDPKILDAAKKEFLEKGYEKASTNAICKSAGVTLIGSNEDFHAQTKEQQEATALHEGRDGNPFVDYIYAHFDVFRLLLCCAGGSSYGHYMDALVDILERSTRRFMEATGHEAVINGKKAGEKTVHILISSYLYGLFEPVAHEMEKVEAITYVNELKYFFDVGWADILRLE